MLGGDSCVADWPHAATGTSGTLRRHRAQTVWRDRGGWAWRALAAAPRQPPGNPPNPNPAAARLGLLDFVCTHKRWQSILSLLITFQSYVSSHTRTVLLDPLPAMTQLLDRFASYRIMSKLHSSLRGLRRSPNRVVYCFRRRYWHLSSLLCLPDGRICSPPYLEIHSTSDLTSIQQAVTTQGLSFPLSQFASSLLIIQFNPLSPKPVWKLHMHHKKQYIPATIGTIWIIMIKLRSVPQQ